MANLMYLATTYPNFWLFLLLAITLPVAFFLGLWGFISKRRMLARISGIICIIYGIATLWGATEAFEDNASVAASIAAPGFVLLTFGAIYVSFSRKKKEPIQPPEPSRGNGT